MTAQLKIRRCACGYGTLLDRVYCPRCRELLQPASSTPSGVVLTWTVLHVTADDQKGPIGLAMVGLDSGINAMARYAPKERLEVGERVEILADKEGLRWVRRAQG